MTTTATPEPHLIQCAHLDCGHTFFLVPERDHPTLCMDHAVDAARDERAAEQARRLNAYRLTEGDEATVSAALVTTVDGWRSTGWRKANMAAALDTLVRIGAHAIGCGINDLRQSEIVWITERAREAIA